MKFNSSKSKKKINWILTRSNWPGTGHDQDNCNTQWNGTIWSRHSSRDLGFNLSYSKQIYHIEREKYWCNTISKSEDYIKNFQHDFGGMVNHKLHISWSVGHITYIAVCLGETKSGLVSSNVVRWQPMLDISCGYDTQ